MATATRTDVHSPSKIVPSDYYFVALDNIRIETMGDVYVIQQERAKFRAHQEKTGAKFSTHSHGGNCHICGTNNAIYLAIFYHIPSNEYIFTGFTCAEKLEYAQDGNFDAFRTACQQAIQNKAGKRKAEQILSLEGLEGAWDIYCNYDGYVHYPEDGGGKAQVSNGDPMELLRANEIVKDIVGKVVKYGNLSPKQADFVGNLLDKIKNWDTIVAEREATKAALPDVPEGRIQITGYILTVKRNEYYDHLQMLVETVEGYRVWGSVPASLMRGYGEIKLRKITMKASVTKSDNDSKFGFFKRPHGAEFIDNHLFIS